MSHKKGKKSGNRRKGGNGGTGGQNRIQAIREERNELLKIMQSFCMDPTKERFEKVNNHAMVKRDVMHYNVWLATVEYMYYDNWGMVCPKNNQFEKLDDEIPKSLEKTPKRTHIEMLWHMFYASGDHKYLDSIMDSIGRLSDTKPSLTGEMIDHFIYIKQLYYDTMNTLIQKNPKHFDELGVNQDYFDLKLYSQDREKKAIEAIKKREDLDPHAKKNPLVHPIPKTEQEKLEESLFY